MSNPTGKIQIQLTSEQKAAIKNATGKDAEVLELGVMELEERIAPESISFTYGHPEVTYKP